MSQSIDLNIPRALTLSCAITYDFVCEGFGGSLGAFREFAVDILLNHQSADRYGEFRSEATVLHIYRKSYLGIVHWCETHKDRMVLSSVLCGAGLAAYLNAGQIGAFACTAQHCAAHTPYDVVVVLAVYHGVSPMCVERIQFASLDFLNDVRSVIVSSVGERHVLEVVASVWGGPTLVLPILTATVPPGLILL